MSLRATNVVAVKLITLVARSDIYQLRLKNIWKQTRSPSIQISNESQRGKALSNNDCFSILDYSTTQYSLSIEEGMHIGCQKPALNKHVDFLTCSICV